MEMVLGQPRRGRLRARGPGRARPDGPAAGTLLERLRALAVVLPPTAVFTHLTAAAVRGWSAAAAVDPPVFVARDRRVTGTPSAPGVRVARLTQRLPARGGGRRCRSPQRPSSAARRWRGTSHPARPRPAGRRGARGSGTARPAALGRGGGRSTTGSAAPLRAVLPLLDARSLSRPWESVACACCTKRPRSTLESPSTRSATSAAASSPAADLWLTGTRRIHEYDGGVHREPDRHRRDLGRETGGLVAGRLAALRLHRSPRC